MSQTSNGNQQTSNAANPSSGSLAASSGSGTPVASATTSVNTIPQTAPPGTISFTIPAQTATASYYKIMANNPLTFGWNFTSLLSTPAALTVQAYCSQNGNTYPVGPANAQGTVEGVIPGTATAVTWDAFAQQTGPNGIPLVQATYTLRVFDERGVTAGIEPGKLQVNQNVKFAMYSPAAYTPIASGWQCTVCNSSTSVNMPSFFALSMTLLVMVVSGVGFLRGLVRN
ncbi:transmembrane protein [Ceratobasidium sp. AG-Ba]|nr:transmembrane protein [Ceratobasidium sp. AG-Ba]QRW11042.1 transmembrane protein [Ceratobasidium sp. AG-Ba]